MEGKPVAMVKCKECGAEISSKAKTCPKCGAKTPKKTSLLTWLVLFVFIFAVFKVGLSPTTSNSSSTTTTTTPTQKTEKRVQEVKQPQWDTSTSKDEMSGKHQAFASSPIVFPIKKMDFPYADVNAWIGVGCDGTNEWAYIGFNKSPNLADTETEDGYNVVHSRIKWDNTIQNVTLIQKWGASFLHFQNDQDAISKMMASNIALLELNWYGQQNVHFKFTLNGSSAALKSIRNQCAKWKQ